MSADLLIRDLLLSEDVSGQVELLLNLLSDAAAGRELSSVVSEVIQVAVGCVCLVACLHPRQLRTSGILSTFGMNCAAD